MKIGLVLADTPSYSETFFNSKVRGLTSHGFEVILFVQTNTNSYTLCKVIQAPKISKNRFLQVFVVLRVMVLLLPYLKRAMRFIRLEKTSGRSYIQIFKNIITNSHILKSNLDWLHFGFATMVIQSENVAHAIEAKMAVSFRGYDISIYPLINPDCYELLWRRVDKVHVISNDLLKLAYKNGMHKENIVQKISPAIDVSMFKSILKKSIRSNVHIITLARLHWKKGLLDTLQALEILKSSGISFHYEIIGIGLEYEALSYAIHQLGLENNVSLLGKLSHKKALRKLTESDIYVQYSLSEGFCNAVLEAQASGCLCIVSDAEGLSENVLHNKTGWVVPKHNPKALANSIKNVLQMSDDRLNTIRKWARQRAFSDFNILKQKEQFIDFYNN